MWSWWPRVRCTFIDTRYLSWCQLEVFNVNICNRKFLVLSCIIHGPGRAEITQGVVSFICIYVLMWVLYLLLMNVIKLQITEMCFALVMFSKYICWYEFTVSSTLRKDCSLATNFLKTHDDVIKWKPFPRHWPFVWGIHRSPVNSPHKGPWRGDLKFSLICALTNAWVNKRDAGDLRRHCAHREDVMTWTHYWPWCVDSTGLPLQKASI